MTQQNPTGPLHNHGWSPVLTRLPPFVVGLSRQFPIWRQPTFVNWQIIALAKGVPLRAGFWWGNRNGDDCQGQCLYIRDTDQRKYIKKSLASAQRTSCFTLRAFALSLGVHSQGSIKIMPLLWYWRYIPCAGVKLEFDEFDLYEKDGRTIVHLTRREPKQKRKIFQKHISRKTTIDHSNISKELISKLLLRASVVMESFF